MGYDLVPEPKIIDAALRACRRLNDFASAVRILEVVKVSGAQGAAAAFCGVSLGFLSGLQRGCLHPREQVGNDTQGAARLGVIWRYTGSSVTVNALKIPRTGARRCSGVLCSLEGSLGGLAL